MATNILAYSNSLRVSFQIASLIVAVLMHFSKRAKVWIILGVCLCVLGQGIEIYLVNIDGTHAANEASFITSKTIVGVGRGFYQTAAQVCVQAVVRRDEVAVATGVFFAAMNLGGAIGTRYVLVLIFPHHCGILPSNASLRSNHASVFLVPYGEELFFPD